VTHDKKHAEQINQLKLQVHFIILLVCTIVNAFKVCNDSHKYVHALTQLDDFNWLLMAISHNDIPHIHEIVNVAL
jgi:hypothetical protein